MGAVQCGAAVGDLDTPGCLSAVRTAEQGGGGIAFLFVVEAGRLTSLGGDRHASFLEAMPRGLLQRRASSSIFPQLQLPPREAHWAVRNK
jgi:hypothetical protein